MQLTQKETSLLKDLKDQEKLCEEKYRKHAAAASDPQLKNLFSRLAQTEKAHYDMLVQMEQGAVPPPPTGGEQQTFSATYQIADTPEKQNDCYLCTDLLTAEKYQEILANWRDFVVNYDYDKFWVENYWIQFHTAAS